MKKHITRFIAALICCLIALSCDKSSDSEDHLSQEGLIGLWEFDSVYVYFDGARVDVSQEPNVTIYNLYLDESGHTVLITPSYTFTDEYVTYNSFYSSYEINEDQVSWWFFDARGIRQSLFLDYKGGFLLSQYDSPSVKGYISNNGKEYGFDGESHQLSLSSRYRKSAKQE